MHQIFFSYSFKNEHQPLISAVRAIVECAGFRLVDGKALPGFSVGPEVLKKMKACNGIVCIVTPQAHASGWVNAEFFQAVGSGMTRAFVLCHDSVQLPNPYQGIAVSSYSDADPLPAITTLAATLGMWKQGLGNLVRAVLLPDTVGVEAYQQNAKCEYRCEEMSSFTESDWHPARLKPIDAGIHAILPEVPLDHSVQIRVTYSNKIWTSAFTPQQLRLELKQ